MRITIISGSYPPDVCGVGDYTQKLEAALTAAGASVAVVTKADWHAAGVLKLARTVQSHRPDVVHIQYPTVGYGHCIGPQVFNVVRPGPSCPCVVTVHEVSQAKVLRQVSLLPFALGSARVVFTSEFERDYALRFVPWIKRKCSIIPIGSNILPIVNDKSVKRVNRVVYFGLLRPNRGLEDYLKLVALARQNDVECQFNIVGKICDGHQEYYRHIRELGKELQIDWMIDYDDENVANILLCTKVAYVPYPDGASERRGSLLALLASGVATVTTAGKFTTPGLEKAVQIANTPDAALSILVKLLADSLASQALSQRAVEYARAHSWEPIAAAHLEMYRKAMGRCDA